LDNNGTKMTLDATVAFITNAALVTLLASLMASSPVLAQ
jgi:hypothetical protein